MNRWTTITAKRPNFEGAGHGGSCTSNGVLALRLAMLSLLTACTPVPAEPTPGKEAPSITLRCNDLKESSGLAWSLRAPHRVWTHNDSGDSARLFCFDSRTGRETGRCELSGIKAVDWEAMAAYHDQRGNARLIVADSGDNGAKRDHILLHVIDEPDPDRSTKIQPAECRTIKIQHAGGPMDCEAIAVDPTSRSLILVGKAFLPGAVVETIAAGDWMDGKGHGAITAKRLTRIPVPMVTGIDVAHRSGDIWLSSYFNLFHFARRSDESLANQLARKPRILPVPRLQQIEAIACDDKGKAWVSSEGSPAKLARIDQPAPVDKQN